MKQHTYRLLPFPSILFIIIGFTSLMLAGCSNPKIEYDYSKSNKDRKLDSYGKLGGDIYLMGGPDKAEKPGEHEMSVNAFLWRASLDTVSFMPLLSADPFGGVIITDWYEMPDLKDERHKLTISILSSELRASGVTVSVFKQKRKNNQWVNIKTDEQTTQTIENAILTKARELRIAYARNQ